MRSDVETAALTPPVSKDDHIAGYPGARVTLVEYGDYECPFCAQAHVVIQDIRQVMGDDLKYVFRNFPLSTLHPHANQAAGAAEVAGSYGKFWPMHDLLYENQKHLDLDSIMDYAAEIGLDVEQFSLTLGAGKYQEKIRRDFLSAIDSGVNGTPTFFINGLRYNDPWDARSLLTALEKYTKH